jgi:hypothetical protein
LAATAQAVYGLVGIGSATAALMLLSYVHDRSYGVKGFLAWSD